MVGTSGDLLSGPRSGRCSRSRLSRLRRLGPSAPGVEPNVLQRVASSVVGRTPPAEKLVASTTGKKGCRCLQEILNSDNRLEFLTREDGIGSRRSDWATTVPESMVSRNAIRRRPSCCLQDSPWSRRFCCWRFRSVPGMVRAILLPVNGPDLLRASCADSLNTLAGKTDRKPSSVGDSGRRCRWRRVGYRRLVGDQREKSGR